MAHKEDLKPRYGTIPYTILQDIELAVIVLKEIKYLLHSHYKCDHVNSLGGQIQEFKEAEYTRNLNYAASDNHEKNTMCVLMKNLLYQRNNIVHVEGIDFLGNRTKFINHSRQIFDQLSPKDDDVICVTPSRHGVLVPCPNSQSLLEDLTFIDYEQYEDVSVAVKVSKRIDHILREIFRQSGDTLGSKIHHFPYANDNIKRKMFQVNTIRNKLIHERYTNNLANRIEFINLSKSIFANLMTIADSAHFRTSYSNILHSVDQLSNMESSVSNNRPVQDTALYEKLSAFQDSVITVDYDDRSWPRPLDSSTQKDYELGRRGELEKQRKAQWADQRDTRRNQRYLNLCRNTCIGLGVVLFLIIILVVGIKLLF